MFERLRADAIEFKEVRFLVPAKVSIEFGSRVETEIVSVDVRNQEVFSGNEKWNKLMTEKFFRHLHTVNTLPENTFEASEEIYERAAEAKAEHDRINQEQVGD